MNEGSLKIYSHWLRGLWGGQRRDGGDLHAGCCVSGCDAGSVVLVAARGSSSLWMCSAHAERWLESREGLAAESDPRRGFKYLARWARAAGAESVAID